MSKKWLLLLNIILFGLAIGIFLLAITIAFMRPSQIEISDLPQKSRPAPRIIFAQPNEAYETVFNTLLKLNYAPPSMRLPDLRQVLSYYGPNGRPDVVQEKIALHFSLADGKSQAAIGPGQKLFLLYDRTQTPNRYVFSPNNKETSLWITAEMKGNEAVVEVSMKDEKNQVVRTPSNLAQLKLPQKEFIRSASTSNWEIGKWRVDGTLLGRQRARWYGLDKFLEKHGGEEYSQLASKQRIDFGEGEEIYSVYVGPNEILVWDNNRWNVVDSGPDSVGKPLLQVKKIDERLMNLELWDVEGKNKIPMTLLKSTEPWQPQRVEQEFKFIAARTRSQYIFEVQKERMLIKPHDWILATENGWKILNTEQEIDDYVNRKIRGMLFVFDGIGKKEDRQVIFGTLFNPSRSESQSIELIMPQANVNVITLPSSNSEYTPPPPPPSYATPPQVSGYPSYPGYPVEKEIYKY